MANLEKLLFMHIPKTAGSSLNAYFEAQFPASQSALHIENQILGVPKEQLPTFDDKNFLSAHLKYDTLKEVLDIQKFFTMTMLRNPVDQTLSHLGWMNKLGFPENAREFNKYPDYIKQIVERMHSMDIVSYFDTMNEHEKNFFDNCQTRYFLSIYGDVELTKEHLNQALLNLSEFNLIGLVEKFQDSLLLLAYHMNWQPPEQPPKRNLSNKKYFLDLNAADEEVKNRFRKFIYYDQILYASAVEIFETQKRDVIQLFREEYSDRTLAMDDERVWLELANLQGLRGKASVRFLGIKNFLRKVKGKFS